MDHKGLPWDLHVRVGSILAAAHYIPLNLSKTFSSEAFPRWQWQKGLTGVKLVKTEVQQHSVLGLCMLSSMKSFVSIAQKFVDKFLEVLVAIGRAV